MTTEEKIEKIRNLMVEKDLDGVLLRKRRSFSWLTNGKSNYIMTNIELGVADLLIFRDRVYCITTKMEFARIQEEELTDLECEWITPEWYEGHNGALSSLCQGKTIGMDVCPQTIPNTVGIDLSQELAELTYVLNMNEINRYRWLSRKVAQALESTCRRIEPGMTEFEIQALLAVNVASLGIQTQVLLVATDRRIYQYRHPIPTEKKLDRYAMVVLCGEKWGLVANATRFVHFGALPEELQEKKAQIGRDRLGFQFGYSPWRTY
ncbi:hypothetical protein UF75_0325 [Desulfosporosinus sp. I2]|uniref:M24 family metallopeptidase n=1 Tax=Desulfosporosinus sp. I2 TaxID=1617025 RepID=UPI00061DFE81|nr:aminopeptidase P family N-terminal domain-containing protein [Desulfosporosinus sp. I2]KJR49247.1 hypothetical protein UF75_0325 [Desulfosporosinus sp. I2]